MLITSFLENSEKISFAAARILFEWSDFWNLNKFKRNIQNLKPMFNRGLEVFIQLLHSLGNHWFNYRKIQNEKKSKPPNTPTT